MRVRVKSTVGLGRAVELDVEPTTRIREIKEKVALENVTEPESISLEYQGRILEDDKTIKECGVKDGSFLSAVPRNREGGLPSPSRLRVEYRLILEEGVDLRPRNPLEWEGFIYGRGKWRGKRFPIKIILPDDYPRVPPKIIWLGEIRPKHPNINPKTQWTCLNILGDEWRPHYTLVTVYRSLEWLFENPNYEHTTHRWLDGILRFFRQG
jgi:ubiquitin-protein ligase